MNITSFIFFSEDGAIDIDEKASITNSKSGKLNSMWRHKTRIPQVTCVVYVCCSAYIL